MSIGKRIAEQRREAGMTQEALGRAVGVSKAAVWQWENDETTPRKPMVEKIAKTLRTSPSFLYGYSGDVKSPSGNPTGRVPVISWVQAGSFADPVDLYEPGVAESWVPVSCGTISECAFALEVEGDSMVSPCGGRSYPPGTIIIVDPERPADPGKRVIARNADGGVTFKELAADAGRYYLKPLNPQYETIRMDGEWSVIGVVCGSFSRE